jgi:hypothetical protein
MPPAGVHASRQRNRHLAHDTTTGETRIPLRLYRLDEPQGDVELVLSRVEASALYVELVRSLGDPQPPAASDDGTSGESS